VSRASLLRLALVLGLLAVLVLWIDLGELKQALWGTPPWLALLGLILGICRVWLMALRWWVLESADQRRRDADLPPEERNAPVLSLAMCFRYRWASSAVNLIGPAAVGPDLGRIALVSYEHADQRIERGVVIILDRLVGMFSFAALGLAAALVAPHLRLRGYYVAVIVIFLLGILAALFGTPSKPGRAINTWVKTSLGSMGRRAGALLDAWAAGSNRLRSSRSAFLWALVISALAHGVSFVLVYLAARVYGAPGSFYTYALVTAISWLVTAIPLGVGGLGLRELSFAVQLAPQGVSPALATAISLFQFAVVHVVSALGVPVLALSRRQDRKTPVEMKETHGA